MILHASSKRTLHITFDVSSYSLACRIAAARAGERAGIVLDALLVGATPPFTDDQEWALVRGRSSRPSSRSRTVRTIISERERLLVSDEVVIWAGNSLGERLSVMSVIAYLDMLRTELPIISIVDTSSRTEASARSLLEYGVTDASRELGADDVRSYLTLWDACTRDAPDDLIRFHRTAAGGETSDVARAVLARYPLVARGLADVDFRLLQVLESCSSRWMHAVADILVGTGWGIDVLDSWTAAVRLQRMGGRSPGAVPLVSIVGNPDDLLSMTATLTLAGRSVLAGTRSALDFVPVDDEILGVHQCAGRYWLRNEDGTFVHCRDVVPR